jgi:hypothetical protein
MMWRRMQCSRQLQEDVGRSLIEVGDLRNREGTALIKSFVRWMVLANARGSRGAVTVIRESAPACHTCNRLFICFLVTIPLIACLW